jgi:hypothetical protein
MSMANNLRNFVSQNLIGVVKWGEHVRMLNDGNRDHGAIEINLVNLADKEKPTRRFKVSMTSSYIKPPLGHMEFLDFDNPGWAIDGTLSGETRTLIADYIKKSVGLKAEDPVPTPVVEAPKPAPVLTAGTRIPVPAQAVVYFTNPGESVAGLRELAAFVTRVRSPSAIDMIVFPPASEPFHRENVPRRDGNNFACRWEFVDGESPRKSDDTLYEMLEQAIATVDDLKTRIDRLESKRGRAVRAQDDGAE